MVYDFKLLRPPPKYPTYPPYHTGEYLEEYFYSFYLSNKSKFDELNVTLIPVFWTNVYNNGEISPHIIQSFLNALPLENVYFTVSQHDDAVREILPPRTIHFSAGGRNGGIPIPLVCSPIPNTYLGESNKDIFCSFVGSISTTSNKCRTEIYDKLSRFSDYYITPKRGWSPTISDAFLSEFIDITKRSKYTLCPRGYGLQSFRFYEAIQLKSVPVFIYDQEFFPFSDILNWRSFSILVHESEVDSIDSLLRGINNREYEDLLMEGQKVYKEFFTLKGVCENILKRLKKELGCD